MASEQRLSTSQLSWLAGSTRSSANGSALLAGRGLLTGGRQVEGEPALEAAAAREVLEQVIAVARLREQWAVAETVMAVRSLSNGSRGSLVVSADAVREHAKLERLRVTKGDVRAVCALAIEWPDALQWSEAARLERLPASWWKLLLTSSADYDGEPLRRWRPHSGFGRQRQRRFDAPALREEPTCRCARVVSISDQQSVARSAHTATESMRAEASPAKPSSRKQTLPFGANSPLAAFAAPMQTATPVVRPAPADEERAGHPSNDAPRALPIEASRQLARNEAPSSEDRVHAAETVPNRAPAAFDIRNLIAGGLLTLALAALAFVTHSVLTNEPQPRIMSLVLPKPAESAELPNPLVAGDGAALEATLAAPNSERDRRTPERVSAQPERSKSERTAARSPIRSATRAIQGPAPNVGF